MHVGVYLGGFDPQSGGGYTFQVDVLRHLLVEAGCSSHRFTLLCDTKAIESFARAMVGVDKVSIVQVRGAGAIEKVIRLLKRSSTLVRRLHLAPGPIERTAVECGAEIVWFVGGGAPEVMDLPYIGTVWDLQHRLQPWFPEVSAKGQWDIRESVLPRFLQRAAYVIVGTRAGYNETQLFYGVPGERIRLLPHPTPTVSQVSVSPEKVEATLRKYDLKRGYLLYPAQFWPHKNHVNLILGLAALRDRHGLTPRLVLVGSDKGNRAHIESVVRTSGLGDQVRFLGFVPVEDLVVLYRNALALAYLTLTGPENLPPLEAFALDCPVIASDVSGTEEQLADAALLVNPLDVTAIADSFKALHDDPDLRARLIMRGAQRAKAWTGREFVRGVLRIVEEFALIRRNWASRPA
jgi:glycosyltransferase involved in cell wall biosynthesis